MNARKTLTSVLFLFTLSSASHSLAHHGALATAAAKKNAEESIKTCQNVGNAMIQGNPVGAWGACLTGILGIASRNLHVAGIMVSETHTGRNGLKQAINGTRRGLEEIAKTGGHRRVPVVLGAVVLGGWVVSIFTEDGMVYAADESGEVLAEASLFEDTKWDASNVGESLLD